MLELARSALGDRYSIDREIGKGGLGTVFLATDIGLDRTVAVKVLHRLLTKGLGVETILRELAFAARLFHPRILPILDAGKSDGMIFYVAPHVSGGSLRGRLANKDSPLTIPLIVQIADDVAQALSYAHSHNVLHRDLNPYNIMLEDGHARVKDFWIARALAVARNEKSTAYGAQAVMEAYTSPEQMDLSPEVDARSDVYSLACLVYEMLTGTPPVSGPWAALTWADRLQLLEESPDIPNRFVEPLTRALSRSPDDRFETPGEFVDAFKIVESGAVKPWKHIDPHSTLPSPPAKSNDPMLDRLREALRDHYRIEEKVGVGGMSFVFLAHDRYCVNRKVALKVLLPELTASVAKDRFLREIEIVAQMVHPQILPLFDSGDADGMLFYTMPYLEGGSLRERIAREAQLPMEEAIGIIKDVASALDYAHRKGIIHRDIKPANILLCEGQAFVADFGIALAMDASRLTVEGCPLGTPEYMSPEQSWNTESIDHRTDLYGLACVLYEMLAGQPPYTAPTLQALAAKHLNDPVPHIRELRISVPRKVDAALHRALAKKPSERFDRVSDFMSALSPAH